MADLRVLAIGEDGNLHVEEFLVGLHTVETTHQTTIVAILVKRCQF